MLYHGFPVIAARPRGGIEHYGNSIKAQRGTISSIEQTLQANQYCINMAASKYITCSLLVFVLMLLPVPVGDVNGFPDSIITTPSDPSSANKSCFTHVNQTYNRSITLRIGNVQTVRETQLVRTCCAGFSGEHCNITADDPCGNPTCSSYPADAVCAVVTKCCKKIPVLLNSAGIAVECGNHRPIEELRKTKCGNVCPFDPCLGKTCSQFPNAVCLTTPCDCKPLWLLETGVRVDCSTGEQMVSPHRTRQIHQQKSP